MRLDEPGRGGDLMPLPEACRAAGVPPAALREWARRLPELAPLEGPDGRLLLDRRRVELLRRIREELERGAAGPAEALAALRERAAAEPPAGAGGERAPAAAAGAAPMQRPPWEDTAIRTLVERRLLEVLPAEAAPRTAGSRG